MEENMIPRIRIAHLPTPIEPLLRLRAELGGPELFIKRDDQTGLAFGGNKTRKLEFFLADAQAEGARTLITAGAVQSNHCRQTAAAAARYGFNCILVLTGDRPESFSGNLLLDHVLGAELVWAKNNMRDQVLRETFVAAEQAEKKPYLIPYGGSNPTGAIAYAFAVQEMVNQEMHPDWIIFPSSSGGTQAGLVLGARLFGYTGKILGISVDQTAQELSQRVRDLAKECGKLFEEEMSFSSEEVLVNVDYLGGGYGVMGQGEIDAIRMFARLEGIILDPVYTGRAAAGLIDLVRKDFFNTDQKLLFWHTGGTPALFADQYQVF
jgi:D-cysteine desulfhydrase family pyridoxal phosphate-dependent enzyme